MSAARRRWGWPVGLLVGAILGGTTGTLYWQHDSARAAADRARVEQVLDDDQRTRTEGLPAPTEVVREVVRASREHSVVVAPSLADQVSEEDLAQARSLLYASEVEGFLALAPKPDDGRLGYNNSSFSAMWMDGVRRDGHYVVLWTDGRTESAARGMDDEYVDTELSRGQPGKALVRIAEQMATWEAEPEYEVDWETRDAQDYWGGVGGGAGLFVVIGGFLVLPLFLALRWAVSRRR
ncbi:MAG: hypothetical protein ACI379_10385 [Nocardioides sp.]|uniref:hypothetical protein n=1 Tax=Nocardioides sp. TaxID=35761 RepID=UPI003EFEC5DA